MTRRNGTSAETAVTVAVAVATVELRPNRRGEVKACQISMINISSDINVVVFKKISLYNQGLVHYSVCVCVCLSVCVLLS